MAAAESLGVSKPFNQLPAPITVALVIPEQPAVAAAAGGYLGGGRGHPMSVVPDAITAIPVLTYERFI